MPARKRLKMMLSHFKKRLYDKYILAIRERNQYEVKKTNNHPILKINGIVLLKEDKPRIKWRKGKIIKLLYDNNNLARGVERLTTNRLTGKILYFVLFVHEVLSRDFSYFTAFLCIFLTLLSTLFSFWSFSDAPSLSCRPY